MGFFGVLRGLIPEVFTPAGVLTLRNEHEDLFRRTGQNVAFS
jgi:hypothetical protein